MLQQLLDRVRLPRSDVTEEAITPLILPTPFGRHILAAIVALCLLGQVSDAASSGLHGRVMRPQTGGEPIGMANAEIEFKDQAGNVAAQTTTDESGEYEVEIPAGAWRVSVQLPDHSGFQPLIDQPIQIVSGQDAEHDFELTRDPNPLLEEYGIPLSVMGILVVFAALMLICVFITWLPRLMATLDRYHPEAKELTPQAKPKPKDELPEETLVVIAAAVSEAIDHPHRIIHTRELTPEDMAWSQGGRIQHHASHRFRRRDH